MKRLIVFGILFFTLFIIGCKNDNIEPPISHPTLDEALTIQKVNDKLMFTIIAINPDGYFSFEKLEKNDLKDVIKITEVSEKLQIYFSVLNDKKIDFVEGYSIDYYVYFGYEGAGWFYSFGYSLENNIIEVSNNNNLVGCIKLNDDEMKKMIEVIEDYN